MRFQCEVALVWVLATLEIAADNKISCFRVIRLLL